MSLYLFCHPWALCTALRWAWDRADEEPSELLMADSLLPTGRGPYGADDIVINCIGRLPGAPAPEQIGSNAAIPLRLSAEAQRCGAGYVGISTDCVFGVGADAWARAIWPPSGLASAPNDRPRAGPGGLRLRRRRLASCLRVGLDRARRRRAAAPGYPGGGSAARQPTDRAPSDRVPHLQSGGAAILGAPRWGGLRDSAAAGGAHQPHASSQRADLDA